MSYKILKQTDKAFQIEHPDGSTFTVPKKGLSKSMMDKIEKMPGFAEGGPIFVSDPMTRQDAEMGQRLRENELQYQRSLARPSESSISPGYLPEAPVTESEISPIDFISPGMVAAPVKALAKGAGMLGRGAMVVGREAVEAAPRILGNEIGAIGSDVKAGLSHVDKIKDLEKQIAELLAQKNNLMTEWKAANKAAPLEPVSVVETPNIPKASVRKGREAQTEIMGQSGEPTPGSIEHQKQVEAMNRYAEKKFGMPITESKGKFMTLDEINAERSADGLPRLTKAQIKKSTDYEISPTTSTERGETFYRALEQKANPKPDWRSGQIEAQRHIGAKVHEPAHIITGPKNMRLGDFQEYMDEGSRKVGALKTATGESRQGAAKQIQEEIQPMSIENWLRRRMGLPVYSRPQYNSPVYGARMTPIQYVETAEGTVVKPKLVGKGKNAGQPKVETPTIDEFTPPRVALDTGTEYATRLRDPKTGEIFDYIAQSKNTSPENLQRLRDFDENVIRFHPQRGLVESNSPEALINLRAQGRFEEATKRLKTRGEDRFAHGGKVGEKMGYRIIKDAEDHFQVMHPDGSKFTVPKKGISKQMHEKISGMPKFYQGGLMSDAEMEEASMLPAPTFTTPVDAEIESIQNQLGSGSTLSSDVAVPLANKLAQLKTVQGSIIDAKRNPVSGGLPEHYRFDRSAANMPSQEMQPSRAPAVEEEEGAMIEEAPMVQQVAKPVTQAAPQNQYDAMFQTMGGRLAAPAKALATAENDYRMRTLLAQNEAEVRQQEMNDYIGQADKEAADFAEANRVDPNRYWSSMNTGNKIQAALAIALGGIGAGMAGGENQALKIINKAIDADIDAQKENKNSLYNVMLSKHKRHETALAVAKGDALQKVQNALNTFTVQAKTAESQQGAAKLANDLDLQKMAYTDYYRKKNASDYLETQAVKGANLRPEEINLLPKDTQERFINGVGKASNPQTAIKIRETKANADDINDMLDKLEIIRSQSGRELTPSVAAERADTLAKVLIGKLREPVLGPGTMNPEEYKRLQVMIPVVTDIATLDDNVFARLGIVRDIVNTNLDNKIKAEGIIAKPRPKKQENAPGMQQGLMLNK
jgi:predicted RNA binding protein YcfA (HicA-like mRNA interferase family)